MKKIVGYRTENTLNGHFYYGVRTLLKENDSYLGSGVRLQAAVKKYGRENFKRVDLIEFVTFEEALKWERETITEQMINSTECYNLKPGGAGGSLPWSEEKKKKVRNIGTYKKSEETRRKLSTIALDRFKNEPGTFTGKKHTKESKKKISDSKKGKPGKNKGKKLKLKPERRAELRKPKPKEVRDKISETLCQLTKEQIRFLKEDFEDKFGERSKLCREWGINLDQISRIIGRRYKNKRKKKNL